MNWKRTACNCNVPLFPQYSYQNECIVHNSFLTDISCVCKHVCDVFVFTCIIFVSESEATYVAMAHIQKSEDKFKCPPIPVT